MPTPSTNPSQAKASLYLLHHYPGVLQTTQQTTQTPHILELIYNIFIYRGYVKTTSDPMSHILLFTGDAPAYPEGRSLAQQATSHSDAVTNPFPLYFLGQLAHNSLSQAQSTLSSPQSISPTKCRCYEKNIFIYSLFIYYIFIYYNIIYFSLRFVGVICIYLRHFAGDRKLPFCK